MGQVGSCGAGTHRGGVEEARESGRVSLPPSRSGALPTCVKEIMIEARKPSTRSVASGGRPSSTASKVCWHVELLTLPPV